MDDNLEKLAFGAGAEGARRDRGSQAKGQMTGRIYSARLVQAFCAFAWSAARFGALRFVVLHGIQGERNMRKKERFAWS